jgi:excisionase family DNA binding protein
MPKFLSVNEFISATCLSRPTVNRRLKNKEIPHVRVGRKILIPVAYLIDLDKKAKASTSKAEV